jgi:hypothetical protein
MADTRFSDFTRKIELCDITGDPSDHWRPPDVVINNSQDFEAYTSGGQTPERHHPLSHPCGPQEIHTSCQPAGGETTLDNNPPSSDKSRGQYPSLQGGIMAMTIFPRVLRHLQQLAGTLLTLLVDTVRYLRLCLRSPAALAAGNLFLRK